jgi:hypothetical protein
VPMVAGGSRVAGEVAGCQWLQGAAGWLERYQGAKSAEVCQRVAEDKVFAKGCSGQERSARGLPGGIV